MKNALDPDNMPPWLAEHFGATFLFPFVVAGINEDDCAVIDWMDNCLILTMDFLNASPIALQLGIGGYRDLGRLLVASNLSDLCGSGAEPVALMIGVTLPPDSTEGDFKELMHGVKDEAGLHKVPVIGGDSKLGKHRSLVGVAVGKATSRDNLFLKNSAKAGDIIWCSGVLGSAAAAAWGYSNPTLTTGWQAWAKSALTVPNVPIGKSTAVSRRCLGNGGTDISDGLGADLSNMCNSSGVGAVVNASNIPYERQVAEAARAANVPAWSFAFASGGDFQFLTTTRESSREELLALGFFEIGTITEATACYLQLQDDRRVEMPTQGHRDRRALTFHDEIDTLINRIANSVR